MGRRTRPLLSRSFRWLPDGPIVHPEGCCELVGVVGSRTATPRECESGSAHRACPASKYQSSDRYPSCTGTRNWPLIFRAVDGTRDENPASRAIVRGGSGAREEGGTPVPLGGPRNVLLSAQVPTMGPLGYTIVFGWSDQPPPEFKSGPKSRPGTSTFRRQFSAESLTNG